MARAEEHGRGLFMGSLWKHISIFIRPFPIHLITISAFLVLWFHFLHLNHIKCGFIIHLQIWQCLGSLRSQAREWAPVVGGGRELRLPRLS